MWKRTDVEKTVTSPKCHQDKEDQKDGWNSVKWAWLGKQQQERRAKVTNMGGADNGYKRENDRNTVEFCPTK